MEAGGGCEHRGVSCGLYAMRSRSSKSEDRKGAAIVPLRSCGFETAWWFGSGDW